MKGLALADSMTQVTAELAPEVWISLVVGSRSPSRVRVRVGLKATCRSDAPPWLLRSPETPLTAAEPRDSMMASRRSGKLENRANVASWAAESGGSSSSTWATFAEVGA